MVVEAIHEGAFDFLENPVCHQGFLDRVQAALQKDADYRESMRRHADIRARFLTLSPRQKEVMGFVANGRTNKVIALDLGLSESCWAASHTFHRHRCSMAAGASDSAAMRPSQL
jgi:FixJ family two-component response regulator